MKNHVITHPLFNNKLVSKIYKPPFFVSKFILFIFLSYIGCTPDNQNKDIKQSQKPNNSISHKKNNYTNKTKKSLSDKYLTTNQACNPTIDHSPISSVNYDLDKHNLPIYENSMTPEEMEKENLDRFSLKSNKENQIIVLPINSNQVIDKSPNLLSREQESNLICTQTVNTREPLNPNIKYHLRGGEEIKFFRYHNGKIDQIVADVYENYGNLKYLEYSNLPVIQSKKLEELTNIQSQYRFFYLSLVTNPTDDNKNLLIADQKLKGGWVFLTGLAIGAAVGWAVAKFGQTKCRRASRVSSQISATQSKISGLESRISSLKQDLENKQKEIDGLKEDVANLKTNLNTLQSEYDTLKEDFEKAKAEGEEFEKALKENLKSNQKMIDDLKKLHEEKMKELKTSLNAKLKTQLEELQKEHEKEKEIILSQNAELKSELDKAQAQIVDILNDKDNMIERMSELENSLQATVSIGDSIKAQNQILQKEINTLNTKINGLKTMNKEMNEKLDKNSQDLKEVNEKSDQTLLLLQKLLAAKKIKVDV